MRKLAMLGAVASAVGTLSPAPLSAQDMMATCSGEISQFCSDISEGRGRILACLISHEGKLNATCRGDVTATAQKGARNPLVPSGVRKMIGAGGGASVPAACSGDVSSFCSGISPGLDRTLACLYANSTRVSSACNSEVNSALR